MRMFLSSLIFQEKFIEKKSLYLSDSSFCDLFKLIFNTLLECNNDEVEFASARLITKSLFHYYRKKHNHQPYYLYQECNKKNGSFNIWTYPAFWKRWFELDIVEETNMYSQVDVFYFNLLISLSKIMNDLKLNKAFISECIVNTLAKDLFNDKSFTVDLEVIIKKV